MAGETPVLRGVDTHLAGNGGRRASVDEQWSVFVDAVAWMRVSEWTHWRAVSEPWPSLLRRPPDAGIDPLDDNAIWDASTWTLPVGIHGSLLDVICAGRVVRANRLASGVPIDNFVLRPSGAKVGHGAGEPFAFVTRVPLDEWLATGQRVELPT